MAPASPLKLAFARRHPGALAAHLAGRNHDELLQALAGLPPEAAAAVVARLPHAQLSRVLATQGDDTVATWLARASLDDGLTLVLHLEESRRAGTLAAVPVRRTRRTLERLVIYPQKTVGALVNPTVVRLAATTLLEDAISMLRGDPQRAQVWLWIVDDEGRYVGLLDLGKALLARTDRFRVGELAVRLDPLRAETALAAARDLGDWLKHPELPVVDHQDHLLGALSRERLMNALAREQPAEFGVLDAMSSLANQYFRILGLCIGDLLGMREPR